MKKCSVCDKLINIDSPRNDKSIGIERDNNYYCIPCNEVDMFINDCNTKSEIKKESIIENTNITCSSINCCYKCQKPYDNNKCISCNIIDPLSISKKKRKKRK